MKVLRCARKNGDGGQSLVRIESRDGLTEEEISAYVRSADPDSDISFSRNGSNRFLAAVEMKSCTTCRVLADSNCILDSAISRPDGGIQWNIVAPTGAALTRLVDDLKSKGATVAVEKVTVLRTARELTTEQEKVLQTAFELGYFDIPKKVKLEELAKRLQISKATLDVVLRRAQRKIVASHIGNG
ncbi:MAG: helix-turn-helix domain-containing protein [Methanobacteriota archaeon]|nr:MAG: helix-turn-helix domain-containing protein [Euryarchaeota archaeon]